jgi:hypothetical protein
MKKILLVVLGVAGLSVANAKSYSIEVHEPALVGGMTLEPGEYKIEVIEQKALISMGRIHGEAAVRLESAENKYNSTTVRYTMADGKMRIQEIHLGGTKTKLIFSE